jgi:maleate isomerase
VSGPVTCRVGLMIPSSNTMMEPDFARVLTPRATLHTARMFMKDTTAEGEYRMLDEFAMGAARDLATARPDVVVFGCTSAGALRGNDYDDELCAWISAVTGVPTISTIRSVRTAIRESGAGRIGVITPYVAELNEKIKASIETDGVQVVRIDGLGMTENFAIAGIGPDDIVDFAVRALADLDIELVFASCTNFGAMAAITGLSKRLGLPVVTSNQAVLTATVRQLDALAMAGGSTQRTEMSWFPARSTMCAPTAT